MAATVTCLLGLGREVGEAIARRFSEGGHAVIVADPGAKKLTAAAGELPDKIRFFHGDLHNQLGLRNAFAFAGEEHDRIDNLVIVPPMPGADTLASYDHEDFDKLMMRTTRGAALAMQLMGQHVAEREEEASARAGQSRQRGTITFILSVSALRPQGGHFSEAASQGAVLAVMRAGALDLAPQGVRVNAIVSVRPRAQDEQAWLQRRTPMGRAALADEIAEAAFFVASPGAAIMTGETIALDGGRAIFDGLAE